MVQLLKVENPTFEPTSATKGKRGGSFFVKELVYKYANWISAPFYLNVIRTFDAVVTGDYSKQPKRSAGMCARK